MQHLHWYDWLRMATATMSLASLYLLGRRAKNNWYRYTTRLRELSWVMQAFLLLLIEGSIEQILTNVGWGPRTLLSFMVSLCCLRACTRNEGYLRDES
jgi:hypothetical protein